MYNYGYSWILTLAVFCSTHLVVSSYLSCTLLWCFWQNQIPPCHGYQHMLRLHDSCIPTAHPSAQPLCRAPTVAVLLSWLCSTSTAWVLGAGAGNCPMTVAMLSALTVLHCTMQSWYGSECSSGLSPVLIFRRMDFVGLLNLPLAHLWSHYFSSYH